MQHPDGTLVKHKARLCAHGGMQQWGTNYWQKYSPVVKKVTVCLILLLARIFVLAFPQAELEVDIWMYKLIQKMSLNITSLSSTKAYMD
jgi:hypothetical protein